IINILDNVINSIAITDMALGTVEIIIGLMGDAGAIGIEVGTIGIGSAIAIPVAAGSSALIIDGLVKVGTGIALFRNTNDIPSGDNISINQMNQQIKKGQSPKSVERVDAGKGAFEKNHIHFDDGSALNCDGTWKHGEKKLTKLEIEWLINNGWIIPN
ncbi:hypothetical protein KJ830_03810, partial [bacterium]|nr:hypothetical protein [bacterium]